MAKSVLAGCTVGYGSIGYGQISDLPCVNGFRGLKTEMIRLRAIPWSSLWSRERMLPGPSLVDACLLQARELLSQWAPKARSPSSQMRPRCLHLPKTKLVATSQVIHMS